MPRKLRELRSDLARDGYYIDRQARSRQIWQHPLVAGYDVNLAGHNGKDAQPYQESPVREGLRRSRATKAQQKNGKP